MEHELLHIDPASVRLLRLRLRHLASGRTNLLDLEWHSKERQEMVLLLLYMRHIGHVGGVEVSMRRALVAHEGQERLAGDLGARYDRCWRALEAFTR